MVSIVGALDLIRPDLLLEMDRVSVGVDEGRLQEDLSEIPGST